MRNALQSAGMGMQGAEVAPAAVQLAATAAARNQYVAAMARWNVVKAKGAALTSSR